jgi:3D (Asp-Asp-Asp) domain-containing protein
MEPNHKRNTLGLLALCGLLVPAHAGELPFEAMTTVVTATAYNSVASQCDDDPTVAAWGDRLHPGLRAVAVSPDLIPRGLGRNARVRIYGIPGEFVVLDKMHPRWEKRIDIYMGDDIDAARRFGKRQVRIYWSS